MTVLACEIRIKPKTEFSRRFAGTTGAGSVLTPWRLAASFCRSAVYGRDRHPAVAVEGHASAPFHSPMILAIPSCLPLDITARFSPGTFGDLRRPST